MTPWNDLRLLESFSVSIADTTFLKSNALMKKVTTVIWSNALFPEVLNMFFRVNVLLRRPPSPSTMPFPTPSLFQYPRPPAEESRHDHWNKAACYKQSGKKCRHNQIVAKKGCPGSMNRAHCLQEGVIMIGHRKIHTSFECPNFPLLFYVDVLPLLNPLFASWKLLQNTWKLQQQFHVKGMDEHSDVRGFWFREK